LGEGSLGVSTSSSSPDTTPTTPPALDTPVPAAVTEAAARAAAKGAAETEAEETEAAATAVEKGVVETEEAARAVAVCRWGLCPRCPGVGRCLSGVNVSSSPSTIPAARGAVWPPYWLCALWAVVAAVLG